MNFDKIDAFNSFDDKSASLTLFLDQDNADLIAQTWSRLKTNLSLKALHLITNYYVLPDELPLLARLESFSLVNYHANINSVLKQLSSTCSKLYLDGFLTAIWDMETLAKENSALMSCVTHLTLGKIGQSYCSFVDDTRNNLTNISRFVGKHFKNITFLDVRFTSEPKLLLSDFLAALQPLSSLEELHFSLKNDDQLRELPTCTEANLKIDSVKKLCISLASTESPDMKQYFGHIFPNVEHIEVKESKPVCVYELVESIKANAPIK